VSTLPRAAAPLLGFARHLRRCGLAVAPEQISGFMQAVTLLGPRSMADIREAALATLAPSPDRRDEFEAHFRSYFYGDGASTVAGENDEETRVKDGGAREEEAGTIRQEKGGELSTAIEQLSSRDFQRDNDSFSSTYPAR
jgi:uncharacterized protein with von Willebrand factor type A (vWA) domain